MPQHIGLTVEQVGGSTFGSVQVLKFVGATVTGASPSAEVTITGGGTGATGAVGATGNTGATGTTGATGSALASHAGTFTANGATPVTVTNANVTANSVIIITLKTVGGTVGAVPAIQTITPTTGYTVAATALDTSVYNYNILG